MLNNGNVCVAKLFTIRMRKQLKYYLACLIVSVATQSSAQSEKSDSVKEQFPLPFQLRFNDEAKWTFSGSVTGVDGSPVAGADISVFVELPMSFVPMPDPVLIGETQTDRAGQYHINVPRLPVDQVDKLYILTGADNHGVSSVDLHPSRNRFQVDFQLPAERTISGIVIDPGGAPAAGVAVHLDHLKMSQGKHVGPAPIKTAAWPPAVTTNEVGRFVIHRLPDSNDSDYVRTRIDDPRFAPQAWSFTLDGGDGDEEELKLQTKEPYLVAGTVLARDSGLPLKNAWLQVVVSDEPITGDLQMLSRQTRTNDHGHFQARCPPGSGVVVYVYPPVGSPYPSWTMARKDWPNGTNRVHVTIKVPRGVLLQGRVYENESGVPIGGARLTYWVQRQRNSHLPPHDVSMTYWACEYRSFLSNPQGGFTLAVMPGSGAILAKAPTREFVSRQISYDEVQGGAPGGCLFNVEGVEFIDFANEQTGSHQKMTLKMKRGVNVRLKVENPDGTLANQAVLLDPHNTKVRYRFDSSRRQLAVVDGETIVLGCDKDAGRAVYVLDVENQTGAMVKITREDVSRRRKTVRLQPCKSVRVQVVDRNGSPIRNQSIGDSRLLLGIHLIAGESEWRPERGVQNALRFVKWSMALLDRKRYNDLSTDENGMVLFSGLMEGADYRLISHRPRYRESRRITVASEAYQDFVFRLDE